MNVHLFYGSEQKADIERRALEALAVAKWGRTRHENPFAGARGLVTLGDFNMSKADVTGVNVVFMALTGLGLVTPVHSSEVGSSIATDNHYDQVAIFPETSKKCLVEMGVFDYDAVIFRDLWHSAT